MYESYWGGRGVYHPSGARLGVLESEECVLAVDMEDSKDPSVWKMRGRLGVQGWIFPDRGKWHFGCDADARNEPNRRLQVAAAVKRQTLAASAPGPRR